MDFRQGPLEGVRVRKWSADGELVSDETTTFGSGPSKRHDYRVAATDRAENLAAYVGVFEDAKRLPLSGRGDTRSMLLEFVEFGSADVAPVVWNENGETGEYPGYQAPEDQIATRARLARIRAEKEALV